MPPLPPCVTVRRNAGAPARYRVSAQMVEQAMEHWRGLSPAGGSRGRTRGRASRTHPGPATDRLVQDRRERPGIDASPHTLPRMIGTIPATIPAFHGRTLPRRGVRVANHLRIEPDSLLEVRERDP